MNVILVNKPGYSARGFTHKPRLTGPAAQVLKMLEGFAFDPYLSSVTICGTSRTANNRMNVHFEVNHAGVSRGTATFANAQLESIEFTTSEGPILLVQEPSGQDVCESDSDSPPPVLPLEANSIRVHHFALGLLARVNSRN